MNALTGRRKPDRPAPTAPAATQASGETSTDGRTSPSGWRGHLYRLAPLLLAVCGLYAVIKARDLKIGSLEDAGPGMWPLIVSTVMAVTALLLVVRDIPEDYEPWSLSSLQVVAGVLALGAFVGFFEFLGFLVASFLILFVWMKILAREPLLISLVLAVAGTFALNFIFVDLFSVPFPGGLIAITTGG